MGIFSKPKEKDELVLIFNIGSSFVRGALFRAQKSGIPKIIFSAKEPISFGNEVETDNFLYSTIKSLQVVVNKIYQAGLGAPSRVFCVLSSPWYVSQTRTISLKKNTPFVFSTKLADSLIQKEISLFEEEHSIKYANPADAVRTIELKNIRMTLNGYETSKPLDQKAKELEMVIFISMSGERILKRIEDTIKKHFSFNQIKFFSFALSSFTVVRDIFKEQENFLLVDIGGEVTDIFMTKKNTLRESVSFPIGYNFITRGVASGMGCSVDEADSLISLLKDGHIEESVEQKLKPVMDRLRTEWLKKFQESLADLSNDIYIPATLYVATDKDFMDFFRETIKNEQFSQYTLTESKFEVTFLNTQMLHGLAMFEEPVVRDTFLIIGAIYINRFLIEA